MHKYGYKRIIITVRNTHTPRFQRQRRRKDNFMTLHDIATQLHKSTNGRVNGENFTRQALESNLRRWMRNCENNKIRNSVVVEVAMPDGGWLCEIHKFADTADGYDYYIPDTREQEQRIWNALTK